MRQKNQIILLTVMLLTGLFMVSCQNADEGSTSQEARESVSTEANQVNSQAQNATQPAQNMNQQNMNQQKAGQNATSPDPNTPTTTIKFDEMVYDFGSVEKGEKVKYTYTFTNTGSEPLIISNAKPSCGCTVPTWPKEPIAPGQTGEIPVEFSAKAKGVQNKTVTITANTTPAQTRLVIKGTVTDPAES